MNLANDGPRKHKLMSKAVADTIPALYSTENEKDPLVYAKLFGLNGWYWYITEMDPEEGLCFGLVKGFADELGYFSLQELAEATMYGSVPAVERDLHWTPKRLSEVK